MEDALKSLIEEFRQLSEAGHTEANNLNGQLKRKAFKNNLKALLEASYKFGYNRGSAPALKIVKRIILKAK